MRCSCMYMCCGALQCVAVCCNALQCVAVHTCIHTEGRKSVVPVCTYLCVLRCVVVRRSVLRYLNVCGEICCVHATFTCIIIKLMSCILQTVSRSALQCVAGRCSVLQCVAVWCSAYILQTVSRRQCVAMSCKCVAVCCTCVAECCMCVVRVLHVCCTCVARVLQSGAVFRRVLQCVAVHFSMLQHVTWCNMLPCEWCNMLPCDAV